MSALKIQVESDVLDAPALQKRARKLAQSITQNVDATADEEKQHKVENTRGEPITLGVLAITFLTSGAAVALFEVIKAHLQRDRSISISIERPDGTKVAINAANISEAEHHVKAVLAAAEPSG
ncbi:MAG TPA: hypothetical protein DCS30_05645 [Rhizobiales bacterium]|nr:hypothetical protein [Hyphomicrobiales bacterium]